MTTSRAFLLTALLLAPLCVRAGETVSFRVTPPGGKVRLAEVFKLKVEASYPEKYSVNLDTAALEGGDFGLVAVSPSKARTAGGLKTQTFQLRAQAFTLGVSTFPELAWRLDSAGGPPSAAKSPSFLLEVLPAFESSEKEDIRDIYPPLRYLPWPWILAGLLAAAAAWQLYRRYGRGPGARQAGSAWTDARGPHQRALARLGAIRKSPLAAAGRLKGYYTGLTAVLRFYLAEEFGISAELMTTADLARELKRTGADLKTTLAAREFLQKADLVKFAKAAPAAPEADAEALEALLAAFEETARRARAAALAQTQVTRP
ncbi:MAG: hypothetical protein NDI60_05450 [Elusimicrobiales bacterium]|nr:hypothetical protein [Elusimicrobiales bacterium]